MRSRQERQDPGSSEEESVSGQTKYDLPHLQSEIAKVYETVMDTMVSGCFRESPELGTKHSDALHEYIRQVQPKDEFIKRMIEAHEGFEKTASQGEGSMDKEARAELAFAATVSYCVKIAAMMGSKSINVYERKHVSPDEVTRPLFAKSEDFEQDLLIAWLGSEVTQDAFRTATGQDLEFQEGDKVYSYCSPPFSWEQMFGREGLLIVRDDQIVKSVVIRMN